MGELVEIQVPAPEQQKEIIQKQLTRSLVNGETWYLVYTKWLKSFKQYVGIEKSGGSIVTSPGPIDNRELLDDNGELRKALVDKLDYEVMPAECWEFFVCWYGLCNGQKPIPRKVISIGSNYLMIEVYPVELKCYRNNDKTLLELTASKADPINKINMDLKKRFNINQNINTRLSVAIGDGEPMLIKNLDRTIGDLEISSGSSIIIETVDGDSINRCTNNRQIKSSNYSSKIPSNTSYFGPIGASPSTANLRSSRSTVGSSSGLVRQPGVCGLNNLGNTCFMNSILQCMSNCPPITEYFLSGKHNDELNETNPLGMKGEIARVYGELIQHMWSGHYATTNPLAFKIQVGKFNPTFSGSQQHDSQELLTFLLDGLHEDLNRIKEKPYIEVKDQIGRVDSELAAETWENYRKRNDSIIVDTFHGLLKSRVVCPECERVSVTFDPFCYLSLPLPQKKDRIITVRYIPFDGNKRESNFRVSVPRKGIVRDLCQELSAKVECNGDQLLVAEIAHYHFHKFYCNEDSLDNIDEKDVIFVYQLPVLPISVDDEEDIIVPVCFWEKVKPIDKYSQSDLFGVPLLIGIPRKPVNEAELHIILKEKMKRHFVFHSNVETQNGALLNAGHVNKDFSEHRFSLFTMDTTKPSPFPEPLEFVDNSSNLIDIMEENYKNRFFGRMILVVQMTAEQRRELYREKPAEYGPDLILSPQSSFMREKNSKVNIEDCLSLFTTCEKLSADDAWYCPACRKHQRATKKFDIWKLPKILIIHLKRFSYTRCRRDKIDSQVEFPINNLNISNYVINSEGPEMKYDLIGVCNHYGHMGGGHYTAYCKNKDNKEWYCFDDNSATKYSEASIMSSAAYVLFYMAKETTQTEKKKKRLELIN